MIKKNVLLALALLTAGFHLFTDTRTLHFKRISLDEGLSQNSIFCILQDSKGFMWFGTQDGLNKYDGYDFTVYKPDPDNPNSLSHNTIMAICEDRHGNLWLGTRGGGLNRFDPKKNRFTRHPADMSNPAIPGSLFISSLYCDSGGDLWIGTLGAGLSRLKWTEDPNGGGGQETFTSFRHIPGDPASLSSNRVVTVFEDSSSHIWVGTADAGLNRLDRESGGFTRFRHNAANPDGLAHDTVNAVSEDRTGTLWVGTADGLSRFDFGTQKFFTYRSDPGDPWSLSSNDVRNIIEDRAGNIWVGTFQGGLNRFNREKDNFTHFHHAANDPYSLSYDDITALYEDESRILWIGTPGKGLNKFDRGDRFDHYKSAFDNPNSLSDDFVYAVYEDSSGLLWIGTSDRGLDKFDREEGVFTNYRHDPDDPGSLSANRVRTILQDSAGTLWVGTDFGGLNKFNWMTGTFTHYRFDPDDSSSLGGNFIRHIYEDVSGTLWIGCSGGGLNKMDRKNGTFTRYRNIPGDPGSLGGNVVNFIYEAPSEPGILWIGTRFWGFDRFDTQTGTCIHYGRVQGDRESLSSNMVTCIYEDTAGTLWVGTYGGGLNKVVRRDGHHLAFAHYTEKDGLCNNSIYGILEDPQGNLWMSTNKGISRFSPRSGIFKNYTVKDGLQGSEFNGGAYFKSPSGEMFFGGINGFNAFYPSRIKDNPHIPPVVLTGFYIAHEDPGIGPGSPLGQSITWTESLRLPYYRNSLMFEFAVLDFSIPGKNRYAYRMEGLDEGWVYRNAQKRFAAYTNLAPGDYVFHVKGSNNDGIWNQNGVSLRITITPPFWATWWFRLVLLFSALGVFFLWYRKHLKNVRIQAELQTAHDAQMSIMPQEDPKIDDFDISGICVPANEVGGDFFDYVWMNEAKTRFGIAIGDVSGKAMKSAMTAIMTSGMLYLKADESADSVKEIMKRINRPLYFKTGKKVFTALCLACLDTITKEIVFTNAGLHAPLLKSGSRVTSLHGTGNKLPLGIKIDSEYLEKKERLSPGDVVLFFTDGITEARNPANLFYGSGRLIRLLEKIDVSTLSACQVKEAVIRDVQAFSQGAPQHDDITVVVVKVL